MTRSIRRALVAATTLTAGLVGITAVPATAAGTGPISLDDARYLFSEVVDAAVAPDGTTYLVGTGVNDGSLEHNGSGSGSDAFVLAFTPAGVLRDSRFLGGMGGDIGEAIAVRRDGKVVVAGTTGSDDFPTTAGTAGTGIPAGNDAFVTVLSADLSAVVASTVIGGNGSDYGYDVAADGKGRVWMVGSTTSTDLPVSQAPMVPSGEDVLLVGFSADLTARPVTRLLGGTSTEYALGVVGLPHGGAVAVGKTYSADFPVKGGLPGHPSVQGASDAFALRLTPAGAISWTALLGGGLQDIAYDAALDPSGNVVIAGETFSADFPDTSKVARPQSDFEAGFVTTISATGDKVRRSTVLGGATGPTSLRAVTVDRYGNAFVAGVTGATDAPLVHPFAPVAMHDAYVAEVDRTGKTLRWAVAAGGSAYDTAKAIAIGGDGRVVVAGTSESMDLPVSDGSTLPQSEGSGMVVWLDSEPTVSKLSGPTRTSDRTPTFTFTVDLHGARSQCRVDNGAWKTCTQGRFTPRLTGGRHTVAVRAVDLPNRPGQATTRTVRITS